MRQYTLWIALLCIPLVANAVGGSNVGNGGDGTALEFSGDLEKAWKFVQASKSSAFTALKGVQLRIRLPELKIVTVDDPIESDVGDVKQESTAINLPPNQLILVNRSRWNAIENVHLKEGLALHEVLSLLGMESSGDYKYSSAFVAEFGLSGVDLGQTFLFIENKAEFKDGADIYSIVAKERIDSDHSFFTNIRIDYTISKNGRASVSMQSNGGTLFACAYGEMTDPHVLPKKFVEVARTGSMPIGFMVKGLGVCGATATLNRIHLVVPEKSTANRFYYDVKEVLTADDPIIRDKSGKWEFWYLDQVWGGCGTAGSFYVPSVLTPSDNVAISSGHIPDSISEVPSFKYPFDGFHTYYVSGLRLRDWHSMDLSKQYFDSIPDIVKWNQWCGLPTSVTEVNEKARAMEVLSSELNIFDEGRIR